MYFITFSYFITLLVQCQSFAPIQTSWQSVRRSSLYSELHDESAPSDVADALSTSQTNDDLIEIQNLKLKLLKLCASYDRGFGATPRSRKQVEEIINQLELMNPTPVDAAKGVDGSYPIGSIPLEGIWRMVWTTALDVLNLGGNPLATPGAIYQKITPPLATNIIDFIPRYQSFLPTAFPSSLIRAEVQTRASNRVGYSNRVGLDFEAVKLAPVELLGMDTGILPPLNFNLPRIKVSDLPGVDPNNSPGYFDVMYLDEDMLIIKQNAPGGIFVSIKVPDCEP
jgi:hypothetical protein